MVVGNHFFSPANVMKLLEIVRGKQSTKEVLATSMALAKKLGKVGVLVGNCWGFVGNRILRQRQTEAQKLMLEGAAPWQIDKVLYDFGFPMGPFAMSDLAGLDIGWIKEKSKGETIRDVLYPGSELRGPLPQVFGDAYASDLPEPVYDLEKAKAELKQSKYAAAGKVPLLHAYVHTELHVVAATFHGFDSAVPEWVVSRETGALHAQTLRRSFAV